MVQNYISKNILGKRVSGRVDSTSLACSAEEVEWEGAAEVEPEMWTSCEGRAKMRGGAQQRKQAESERKIE